jgi:hypothetical protein
MNCNHQCKASEVTDEEIKEAIDKTFDGKKEIDKIFFISKVYSQFHMHCLNNSDVIIEKVLRYIDENKNLYYTSDFRYFKR